MFKCSLDSLDLIFEKIAKVKKKNVFGRTFANEHKS